MKIKYKLLFGILVVILLVIAVEYNSISSSRKITKEFEIAVDNTSQEVISMYNIHLAAIHMHSAALGVAQAYSANGTEQIKGRLIQEYDTSKEEFSKWVSVYEMVSENTEENTRLIGSITYTKDNLIQLSDELISLSKNEPGHNILPQKIQQLRDAEWQAHESLEHGVEYVIHKCKAQKELAKKTYKDEIRKTAVIGILIIITILILSMGIAYTISNPISELITATRKIKKGDFTVRFKSKSGDEIGELQGNFEEMSNALKDKNDLLESVLRVVQGKFGKVATIIVRKEVISLVKKSPRIVKILPKNLAKLVNSDEKLIDSLNK